MHLVFTIHGPSLFVLCPPFPSSLHPAFPSGKSPVCCLWLWGDFPPLTPSPFHLALHSFPSDISQYVVCIYNFFFCFICLLILFIKFCVKMNFVTFVFLWLAYTFMSSHICFAYIHYDFLVTFLVPLFVLGFSFMWPLFTLGGVIRVILLRI